MKGKPKYEKNYLNRNHRNFKFPCKYSKVSCQAEKLTTSKVKVHLMISGQGAEKTTFDEIKYEN